MEHEVTSERLSATVRAQYSTRRVAAFAVRMAVLVGLAVGAGACGNKGPLYLPDQDVEKKKQAAGSSSVESPRRK